MIISNFQRWLQYNFYTETHLRPISKKMPPGCQSKFCSFSCFFTYPTLIHTCIFSSWIKPFAWLVHWFFQWNKEFLFLLFHRLLPNRKWTTCRWRFVSNSHFRKFLEFAVPSATRSKRWCFLFFLPLCKAFFAASRDDVVCAMACGSYSVDETGLIYSTCSHETSVVLLR